MFSPLLGCGAWSIANPTFEVEETATGGLWPTFGTKFLYLDSGRTLFRKTNQFGCHSGMIDVSGRNRLWGLAYRHRY